MVVTHKCRTMERLLTIICLIILMQLAFIFIFTLLFRVLWWLSRYILVFWIGNYITSIITGMNTSNAECTNSENISADNFLLTKKEAQRDERLGKLNLNELTLIDNININGSRNYPNIVDTKNIKAISNVKNNIQSKDNAKLFNLKQTDVYLIDETVFSDKIFIDMTHSEIREYKMYKVMTENDGSDLTEGMVKQGRPKYMVEYQREPEYKADLKEFLATLPPDTRAELNLIVKDHKGEILEISDKNSNETPVLSSKTSPKTKPHCPLKGAESKPVHTNISYASAIKQNYQEIRQNDPKAGIEGGKGVSEIKPLSVIASRLRVKKNVRSNKECFVSLQSKINNENQDTCIEKITSDKGNGREKGTKTEYMSQLERDDVSLIVPDEIMLLKLNSTYYQVAVSSYHSLVPIGSARQCFVCSMRLTQAESANHVQSRKHIDSIKINKFLHSFCGVLFRQVYTKYHCLFCNLVMYREEVRMHLKWPQHIKRYDAACWNPNNKALKALCVDTQKEFVYKCTTEQPHIITYVQSTRKDSDTSIQQSIEKKAQIIILDGNIMKISFESWHGINLLKSGLKCILCQKELLQENIKEHINTENHRIALRITFERQFYPALVRKINEKTVNCVTCNVELNNQLLILKHVSGRKHKNNQSIIIERTTQTDSYNDCNKFAITL